MAIDISNLLGKTENEGTTNAGKLAAKEWNQLVQAVQENQTAVKGAIKGVNYNGTPYTTVVDGILQMTVVDTSGRNTKFEWIQEAPKAIAKGGSCIVEFNVIDQVKDENDASKLVSYDQPGKVNFYVDDKLVGSEIGVYDKEYSKYKGPVQFDFGKATALSTKEEGNTLKIEYVNTGVVISKYYTVFVKDVRVSVENFKTVYTTNDPTTIDVIARFDNSNNTKCFIYVVVDDNNIVDGLEVSPNGRNEIKQQFNSYNNHGIHNLKVWGELHIEDTVITTDIISYNYIFGDVTSNVPIVMATINDGAEYELYGKMDIEYIAYLSGENTVKGVSIMLKNNDKTLLSTSQDVNFVNGVGSNKYTFTLFPSTGTTEEDFIGNNRKLIISMTASDGSEHQHVILVNIKESTIRLKQAEDYKVYLTSNGRSNNESSDTIKKWESVSNDKTNAVINVTFDDSIEFLDTGSGWIADEDGNMAMHLQKGKGFTLNYKPFDNNPTYSKAAYGTGKGLTISIEFATRNCLNANATVISCMDYSHEADGRGFYVTASEAKLLGSDIQLAAKFRENTRIKLDLVIEGTLNTYEYDTVVGTEGDVTRQGTSEESMAMMFIDGVYTGITLITSNTSFQQGTASTPASMIRFGSVDCDLDIYNIRIYERDLLINEIVDNYSYDTPVFAEKIAIAQRNNIFGTLSTNRPTIDIGKLRAARPELPFFYVDMEDIHNDVLPQDKSVWKTLSSTKWDNPVATSGKAAEPLTTFEVITGVLRNQGTSSMTYPWPWRNWDWKTGDSKFNDKSTHLYYFPDTITTNETASKWHQYEYTGTGSNLPIKKITLKKDYASSEMCNNAICSELFTDMAIGLGNAYDVMSPAMKSDYEVNKKTDFRLSLKAKPCFMFHTLNDPNAEGTAGAGKDALGMMNLIPNKNEVGYLGFKQNKWENAKDGATEREQSWELSDNLDDAFWVKHLNYFTRNTNGSFVNSIEKLYEARTPKDTSVSGWEADFGFTPKGQATVSEPQATIINDETKDIIDFHNWLVDTNQALADDKPLTTVKETWNDDGHGNALYTTNSKEYRKAKFENEAEKHLILDQWILYYIWREQFWMFDSGFKNLQVYTVGSHPDYPGIMQWGCMVRDADTALGIENTGKDYFPPHIEDIDYYTEANGKITFHYGGAEGIYDITQLKNKYGETANAVLNGQFGSIWVNLRDCFGAKIASMYRDLTANSALTNFSATKAIEKFRKHQENWCESLYNFGMRQYFGGEPFSYFNKSALGDKKNSRAQWLERGFYYRRGKYRNLTDNSAFRINTYDSPDSGFDKVLNVKAYIPMYIGCGGTSPSMEDSKNVIRLLDNVYNDGTIGKPISIGADGFSFPNTGDAVSYIYGTSMLTDIGDLARVCKLLRVQTLDFPKLREFNLGHESARDGKTYMEFAPKYIENENGELVVDPNEPQGAPREFTNEILQNLDCSSMTQLTLLDVTNHTNLSNLTINKCNQLKKLYARGTALKSINLPATTSLETIYLGSQLTALELVNLTGIKDLVIEGLSNCGRLTINNCGEYMSSKSWEVLNMCIDKLQSSYDPDRNPNVVSLRGIKWDIDASDGYKTIERLIDMNADLTGEITLKNLPNSVKIKLVAKYGNIDSSSNALHVKYTQQPITDIKLPSKLYIYEEGYYDLTEKLVVLPSSANTYTGSKWTIGAAASKYVTLDVNGRLYRNDAECEEGTAAVTLTVTISQMNDTTGNKREDIVRTTQVYFYERLAKPGDMVFNDGSFSDELDDSKTAIGVCFYVDPTDKTKRLMCALSPITIGTSSGNINEFAWGAYPGGELTDGQTGGFGGYYGCDPNLKLNGESYKFDLQEITNITTSGTDANDRYTNYFTDAIYRDATNNNEFRKFNINTYYGDLGWRPATNTITVDGLTVDNNNNSYIKVNANDIVPSGYYKTLAMIFNRNKLLDAYKNTKGQENAFIRPHSDEYNTELYNLGELLTISNKLSYESRNANHDGTEYSTYGSLLYYPAASACFAYEPDLFSLNDKFKKHNWFLPASGDMMRILYYMHQSYANGKAQDKPTNSSVENANAFYNALRLGVLKGNLLSSYGFISSTERSATEPVAILSSNGYCEVYTKGSTSYKVLPICKF